MKNIIASLPLPSVFFHAKSGNYYREDGEGAWLKLNESNIKKHLALCGYSVKEGSPLTEADQCTVDIQDHQNVAYIGPLAGFMTGLHKINNRNVLVSESPKLLKPAAGNWPILKATFEAVLADNAHDQLGVFYHWLKCGHQAVSSGMWSPGQVMVLAGPVGAGKSLIQTIITKLLGGRSAHPYQYMTDRTPFNSSLMGAEHLVIEDENESVDIRSRRAFGAKIKAFAANREQHCHGKNEDACTLTPIWRVSVSLNDTPERILVLPPLEEDIRDKITMLKAHCRQLPMPTSTPAEKLAYMTALENEMPAFLHYLNTLTIPESEYDPRFGVRAFHHPELLGLLESSSPEAMLMMLVDMELFSMRNVPIADSRYAAETMRPWVGSAVELRAALTHHTSTVKREAEKLMIYANTCGTLLGRYSRISTGRDRISSQLRNGQTIWTIRPPTHQQAMGCEITQQIITAE